MSFFKMFGEGILEAIISFLLFIDSIVYSLISYVYQIFLVLVNGSNIFDKSLLNGFMERIYLILGVVMLFVVAYSLLKSMVNPDEALKGKESPTKFIWNIVGSVVLIALLPTVFEFAYDLQNSVLRYNTIGRLILGSSLTDDDELSNTIDSGGFMIASSVFQSFVHVKDGEKYCTTLEEEQTKTHADGSGCEILTVSTLDFGGWEALRLIPGGSGILNGIESIASFLGGGTSYGQVLASVSVTRDFFRYGMLSEAIVEGNVTYYFLISSAVGIFVLFVIVSYVIDMALRLVKLAVYELIAPLPILARIVPNEQAKKIFSNWLKATISTFLEVFIRIALLFFAVLLINTVVFSINDFFSITLKNVGSARIDIILIAQCMVIVGIVLFIKQAPAIIKEITGLDGGKYNVLKSAKQGFSLIAGGVVGTSAGNPFAGFRAWDEAGQAKRLTDFSAIGNQFKRREANREATELQKAAGMSGRQRVTMNATNGFRRAFGFDDLKGQADKNFEHNRDMEGNQFTAANDTGTGIRIGTDAHGNPIYLQVRDSHGSMINLDEHATDILLNDENINAMNDVKARNAITKSQIAEQIRRYDDINKSNAEVATLIKAMEDKAKSEMGKGKYNLKDATGGDLVFSYVDAGGHMQTWGAGGHTQEEYEKWLEAMQDKLSPDEYARLAQQLKTSINVDTVEHFIESSGDSEIATLKTKLFDRVNTQHILNMDGTERRNVAVNTITSKATAQDISYQEAKALKKDIEENVKQAVDQEVYRQNMSKSQLDTQDAAIDRIIAQGKEQVEAQKTSSEYKAYEASSKAQQTRKNGDSK